MTCGFGFWSERTVRFALYTAFSDRDLVKQCVTVNVRACARHSDSVRLQPVMVHPVRWVDEKDKNISDLHQTCPGLSVDQSNSQMNILAFVSAISFSQTVHLHAFVYIIYISNLSICVSKSTSQNRIIFFSPAIPPFLSFSAWLPAEERVELVMAEALTAARRLCALHHRLEPTRHVYFWHLVTTDETVFLWKKVKKRSEQAMEDVWC